ncbi:permease-like cell division protein FtsX [Anaeromicropila populeti]|uniref:Cell division protein FtsX n=1 Tax=Anaeromicropila populeti TaxID=37658 RepID=A0A1I6IEI3_9FIRM|nr:permease-like cell division protein FtsX [Anaeromicropila populeti]SFR65101.1 cell division transport system permease protein [Anaeromicropila populeti]
MKRISLLWYSIVQGLKNFNRNRMFSWASIGTITACLFLFGIFYFVISNLQYMIKNAETSVGVTVFFDEGISQEAIDEIGNQIKAREEVKEVNFISAEQAWENYKETVFEGQEELLDTFNEDNPLKESASYEVFLKNIEKQDQFVKYVEGLAGVRQVNNSELTVRGLISFNSLVAYISAAIIIILVAVAVFLIHTSVTMGISTRKDEIKIMRLVGASDFLVKAPFIVEGLIVGLIGAVIPLLILFAVYEKIISYIAQKSGDLGSFLTFLPVKEVFASLTPVSMAIGVGIGFIGSYITVRRHLKV